MSVVFVSCDEAAKVLEPADRSLYFPASPIAPKLPAVLRSRFATSPAMGADQLDTASGQPGSQRIAVGRPVVDQPLRTAAKNSLVDQRFDKIDFCWTGTGNGCRKRNAVTVGENHGLGSLASFRLPDQFSPFFADENVPSAIVSLRSIRPCRSSARNSLAQALAQRPASVHFWNRRQQVGYEGKCLGRSFQRAPLRNTQRMPSTHRRGSIAGRPRWPVRGSCGNRLAINRHCSSVNSNLGSILDPAGPSDPTSRDRLDISGLLSDHCYEFTHQAV